MRGITSEFCWRPTHPIKVFFLMLGLKTFQNVHTRLAQFKYRGFSQVLQMAQLLL